MRSLLARGRSIATAGMLLAAALGLLAATQPWGSATLLDGRVLAATGQELAGGVTVMALACAVLALLLPIAGRAWRYVLGALAALLGTALVAHVQGARAGVANALEARIAEATGLAGTAQGAEVAAVGATAWPDAGLAAGAVAVAAAAWVLASSHRWPERAPRAARYERTGSGLAWDAMDDGEDPTR